METTEFKNQFNAKANQVADKASHVVDRVKRAGESLLDSPVAEQFSDKMADFRDRSVEAYDSSIELVRRNPVASIATALGIGVIAGLAWRSSRRH